MAVIAITGGSGFIGRRLVSEHLRRGDRVRILTRRLDAIPPEGVRVILGDLAMPSIPAAFLNDVDIIYHCAAELRDPMRMQAVNCDGTRRLADAAAGRIGRWVQLSSVGVYGLHRVGEVTENTPISPCNEYEASKAEGDKLVLKAAEGGAFQCVLLRPSTVLGPDMTNRALFDLASMVRRGLFFHIGPVGASANYIPVDNVVDALILCAEHPSAVGRIYNLSDWVTMEEFVAYIACIVGASNPRLRLPLVPVRALAALLGAIPSSPLTSSRVDALSGRSRYPIRRIQEELGYTHRVSLADTLRAMLTSRQQA